MLSKVLMFFVMKKKLPRYILLHIALATSKIITIRVTITFCITVTFCVSYYILWPNRRSKNVLLFLATIGLWDLMRYGSAQIFKLASSMIIHEINIATDDE